MVTEPDNGKSAIYANGGTVGFVAHNRDVVQKFHETGLANGSTDEGHLGPRDFSLTAYASYLRDPHGHKICTYYFAAD